MSQALTTVHEEFVGGALDSIARLREIIRNPGEKVSESDKLAAKASLGLLGSYTTMHRNETERMKLAAALSKNLIGQQIFEVLMNPALAAGNSAALPAPAETEAKPRANGRANGKSRKALAARK